ncbi:MAG: tRNA (guanosine(46)-N7)-methyltransferase TrmB [Clostridia bacterium]|nr:tRNA (guanosine(46)-N7)-methyltransferase TrmB [Clostridia bacterium]
MRIRFKPWARGELEASEFYIDNPEDYKGRWKTLFENDNPIHLELGCGKGGFISKLASQNLNVNYIAIDMVDAMLGLAKRNIENEYNEKNIPIKNVYLTRFDIERILLILDDNDKINRIYINFCNPWPRGKHRKKRLTHTRQLEKYRQFLKENGEIYFKTDDDGLFNDSLLYLEQTGFEILGKTYDLANENDFWDNIETEHEKMFKEQGIKIKAVKARKK